MTTINNIYHIPDNEEDLSEIDKAIIGLYKGTGYAIDENSNKDSNLISTIRDLTAGEVSKHFAKKYIFPKDVVKAHEEGLIHIHDLDYCARGQFNCSLPNFKDMLDNGTIINNVKIETPKSFATACTLTTQILACCASSQFGGISIDKFAETLAPYLRKSLNKNRQRLEAELELQRIEMESEITNEVNKVISYLSDDITQLSDGFKASLREKVTKLVEQKYTLTEESIDKLAKSETTYELRAGIQTIGYQISTLSTVNGQAPFVTILLSLDPESEYIEEQVLIIQELLEQRLKGIKNESGHYITPTFPKILYVLDEYNVHPSSPYYFLTVLAARTSAKRMYPDFVSAKIMRERYEGLVFSSMGCRSFLPPYKNENGEYVTITRFNKGVVSIDLPMVALRAGRDRKKFFEEFDKDLELVYSALKVRHNIVAQGLTSDNPTMWCGGGIARLPLGIKIPEKYLIGGFSTLSLGYGGLYECTQAIIGKSHTSEEGREFAMEVMDYMNMKKEQWNAIDDYGVSIYGIPGESTLSQFANAARKEFGIIPNVTSKPYFTNSFHIHVTENIDMFSKFKFETDFAAKSLGGCLSYCELGAVSSSDVILNSLEPLYNISQYWEYNTTNSDFCAECESTESAHYNEVEKYWECSNCGNHSPLTLSVIRRTCGYLGSRLWVEGRASEIEDRVTHVGNVVSTIPVDELD